MGTWNRFSLASVFVFVSGVTSTTPQCFSDHKRTDVTLLSSLSLLLLTVSPLLPAEDMYEDTWDMQLNHREDLDHSARLLQELWFTGFKENMHMFYRTGCFPASMWQKLEPASASWCPSLGFVRCITALSRQL